MADNTSKSLYGLIGYPLGHSFSKDYFNQKFSSEQINAEYINLEIPDINFLMEVLSENYNLCGLNVTIPYKEKVIPFLDELDADHAAEAAHIADAVVFREPFLVARHDLLADGEGAVGEVVALHDLDGLERGRAGERVAAERAADRAGRRSFHDFLTRDDGRERHAGGDGFRRCDDIRLDTRFLPIFGSEHASRAAEAGLDFVCHEQDALLVADLADGLDPLDRRGDEAAFALQRLDDDRHLR